MLGHLSYSLANHRLAYALFERCAAEHAYRADEALCMLGAIHSATVLIVLASVDNRVPPSCVLSMNRFLLSAVLYATRTHFLH